MKTKRFDFNFKPLQINVSMVVEGGVSDSQNYDADTDTYTPDYTIDASNLIVQPNISRLDKDEVLTPGLINQDLANVVWYEVNKGSAECFEEGGGGRSNGAPEGCIPAAGQHVEVKQVLEYANDGKAKRSTYKEAHRGGFHNSLEGAGGALFGVGNGGGRMLHIIYFFVLLRCESAGAQRWTPAYF